MSFEDTVNLAKIVLEREMYVMESKGKLFITARGDTEIKEMDTENEFERRSQHERKINWKEKMMHGQLLTQMEEVAHKDQWLWLEEGGLKSKTEALIMAARKQALRTNLVKAKIDKTQDNSKCRIFGKTDESTNHLLSEYSKRTQKEYKYRHKIL